MQKNGLKNDEMISMNYDKTDFTTPPSSPAYEIQYSGNFEEEQFKVEGQRIVDIGWFFE